MHPHKPEVRRGIAIHEQPILESRIDAFHGAWIAAVRHVQCVHPASSHVLTLSDGRPVELLEPLGTGSLGTVYRALLESGWGLRRHVAVKVIAMTPEMDHGETMRHLGRMARRAACIRHPSIVQLLEIDRTDALDPTPAPFVVTELVEGESLASLMRGWEREGMRVPLDFATVVTLRAAEALDAALFTDGPDGSLTHLVHGDLSPRQILISNQGEVKVGDFGQFTLSSANSHIRARAHIAHTAPEVACGSIPNTRSDVFSLGIVLHELLVGPRFAKGTTIAEAARMVREGQSHTKLIEPNLPRALRDIINRATDRNPMERYPHARSMAFDLRREMLQLGLCDTQTCVRHTVVGWYGGGGQEQTGESAQVRIAPLKSDVAPILEKERPSGVDVVGHADLQPLRPISSTASAEDTASPNTWLAAPAPHAPRALRGRR
jgi:serine/threonine protein kinase